MEKSMNPVATLVTAAALMLGAATASADAPAVPSGTYALEKTHASLTWSVNHLGLSNYTARFTGFDVTLTLDADSPEKSSVTASIDPLSVRTDYPGDTDFDGEIARDPKFLNAGTYPSITFTSTRVEMTGETTARIHGNMTMLGVTKPLVLDATLNGTLAQHPYAKVPAIGFHAEGTVKRSDFGFSHLTPYVGDEVSFVIEAEFLKAK
jgi:polyisoprenoid-binding protein YceI